MAKQRKRQEIDIAGVGKGLVISGVAVGLGSSIIAGVGGPTVAPAQAGLTTVASFLPPLATIGGGFIVVRQLQGLQSQVERQTKARKRRI